MSLTALKIGLLKISYGSYDAIAGAIFDMDRCEISSAKLRRVHLGESLGALREVDALFEDIETDYIPASLSHMRTVHAGLQDSGDKTLLCQYAVLMKTALSEVPDWDNGQDDRLDYRRTGPFRSYLLGHAFFATGHFQDALSHFRASADGFWSLAPGETAISSWEVLQLALAQQMALVSAYEVSERQPAESRVIQETAELLLAQGASKYLNKALEIAPVWKFAYNYASMLASADIAHEEQDAALARAIHIHPQLAMFECVLQGMEESVAACAYLSKVAQRLEISHPALLLSARQVVSAHMTGQDAKPVSARDLPKMRRQLQLSLRAH